MLGAQSIICANALLPSAAFATDDCITLPLVRAFAALSIVKQRRIQLRGQRLLPYEQALPYPEDFGAHRAIMGWSMGKR